MDEFQHFEKLSADNDFEGGQWIGSEYVYKKNKKKAQQTEDDRLYGVFQGSSDDEDEGFRTRKRRKAEDTRSLHKPMAFVSSGVVTQTTEAEADIKEDPEQQQVQDFHPGLGAPNCGFRDACAPLFGPEYSSRPSPCSTVWAAPHVYAERADSRDH